MRKPLVIILSVEFFVAIVLGQGGLKHPYAFDRAFMAWYKNPTDATRTELRMQRHLNTLSDLGFSAVAFGGMAWVTLLAADLYSVYHGSRSIIPSRDHNDV